MIIKEFSECITECTSAPCAAEYFCEYFKNAGFKKLDIYNELPKLSAGRYYADVFGNSVLAFAIGEEGQGLRIASGHIDSPCFCIKPNPEMYDDNMMRLNIEVYGGPILNSWYDRPLSVSGRVVLRTEGDCKIESKVMDLKNPLFTIPNLAIHMNREVNKGVEINRQKDVLPLMCLKDDKKITLLDILANELKVEKDAILDYELYVYNCDELKTIGINGEMIMAPRLDNIAASFAIAKAMVSAVETDGINIAILYDNEEVGSRTKQGAASELYNTLIKKVLEAAGFNNAQDIILKGKMMSIDAAHATHPNYSDKSDPTNKVRMNKGIVIKKACSQAYATDARMSGYIKLLCKKCNIEYQEFVNRADVQGGSTLGAIVSTVLPMMTADIGIPMLGMHSACETIGNKDLKDLHSFVKCYYETI